MLHRREQHVAAVNHRADQHQRQHRHHPGRQAQQPQIGQLRIAGIQLGRVEKALDAPAAPERTEGFRTRQRRRAQPLRRSGIVQQKFRMPAGHRLQQRVGAQVHGLQLQRMPGHGVHLQLLHRLAQRLRIRRQQQNPRLAVAGGVGADQLRTDRHVPQNVPESGRHPGTAAVQQAARSAQFAFGAERKHRSELDARHCQQAAAIHIGLQQRQRREHLQRRRRHRHPHRNAQLLASGEQLHQKGLA